MIVTLRTQRLRTLEQVRGFLDGNEPADFELADRTSAYAFVRRTLVRFEYHGLGRPDKGLVKRFIEKVTGFSRAQVTRLVRQHRRTGSIRDHRRKPPANAFQRRYTPRDARPGPPRSPSGSAASRGRTASPAISASTPSTSATARGARASTSSTWSTKSRSSNTLEPCRASPTTSSSRASKPCCPPSPSPSTPSTPTTAANTPTGRVRRRYRQQDVATPHERFKALPGAEAFLRPGVTLGALDRLAAATTDLAAAQAVRRARDELFRVIGKADNSAA